MNKIFSALVSLMLIVGGVGLVAMLGDHTYAAYRLQVPFLQAGSTPFIQTMDGWNSIKDDNPRVVEGLFSYYVGTDEGLMFYTNASTTKEVRSRLLASMVEE